MANENKSVMAKSTKEKEVKKLIKPTDELHKKCDNKKLK